MLRIGARLQGAPSGAIENRVRHWVFNSIVFYSLAAILAAAIIALGLSPDRWPLRPAAQSGRIVGSSIVLDGAALSAPAASPEQVFYVVWDGQGPRSLRIAVTPNRPLPTSADRGTRILLSREAAERLNNKAVVLEITYRPLPVLTAYELAVSLQGSGPTEWVVGRLGVEPDSLGRLRLQLPPQSEIDSLGLRVISDNVEWNYGAEIQEISLTPAP